MRYLFVTVHSVTAQSRGAVLASRHRESGPLQYPQNSVAYLRQVPYDSRWRVPYVIDPADGLWYTPVLDYFIKMVCRTASPSPQCSADQHLSQDTAVPTVHTFPAVRMIHTFLEHEQFICVEKIYVSDKATRSGLPVRSRANTSKCTCPKLLSILTEWNSCGGNPSRRD